METWILCLDSAEVDELTDYRYDRRIDPNSIKRAATTLYAWTRPNSALPETCVPSLAACQAEFRRIPA